MVVKECIIGARVKRGPDWPLDYGDQDENGNGTVMYEYGKYSVAVKWDHENKEKKYYNICEGGGYHLEYCTEQPYELRDQFLKHAMRPELSDITFISKESQCSGLRAFGEKSQVASLPHMTIKMYEESDSTQPGIKRKSERAKGIIWNL